MKEQGKTVEHSAVILNNETDLYGLIGGDLRGRLLSEKSKEKTNAYRLVLFVLRQNGVKFYVKTVLFADSRGFKEIGIIGCLWGGKIVCFSVSALNLLNFTKLICIYYSFKYKEQENKQPTSHMR